MKKLLSWVLILVILTGHISTVNASTDSLSDINDHWAEDTIKTWYSLNVVTGDPHSLFYPDEPITRAEFIAIINNLLGYTDVSSQQFNDVNPTTWYAEEMLKARSAGYLTGYDGNLAKPENPITRQDACVILHNAFKLDDSFTELLSFSDQEKISYICT
ncbi:S-layer homology domain-containing protein [Vallitalea okinawensis]|uniref:S-layer homology domain-containing protein n=1 Tax=Vallitalea okinawensis TaxID=2078660 RepID=UPI000CFB1E56|nr:S-layer homology domain-containing protein [Vallitalea okinawensis]